MTSPLIKALLAGFMVVSTASITFAPNAFAMDKPSDNNTYKQLDLLMNVFERVRAQYVEDVDDEKLLEGAIRGMLASLDPHSGYMGPDSFKENQIRTKGEYAGIGLEVIPDKGVLRVVAPMDNTPGERAGILSGDYITQVNGKTIFGVDDPVDLLRGAVDTEVTLTIVRTGEDEPFDVKLVRQIIIISAVRHRVEAENIGYIRMTTFNNEKLSRDVRRAMDSIRTELGDKLEGLIIDLRNNPGGLLDQAVETTDLFLDRGEIVSMRGRMPSDNARWSATVGDIADGLPIVLLVNAGSASASEIFVGALQDHRRATVVGEKTFGKGVVQSLIPLAQDRALRLTTARYYTPSGASIQAVGIQPDIKVVQPRSRNAYRVRREADLDGHITNENTANDNDEVAPGEKNPKTDETKTDDAKDGAKEDDDKKDPAKAEAPVDVQLDYALTILGKVIDAKNSTSIVN